MIPKQIIHLLSGGLDSVTMLYDLKQQGHNIHCLLFDYQQRHIQELHWAKYHAERCGVLHTIRKLEDLGGLNEKSWIVPNRNSIFLSVAVNVAFRAGADTVTIACNAEDAEYFVDCRQSFIDAKNAETQAAGYNVEICAPYIDWPKWKIGGLAREMGIKSDTIWSCYIGGETPCGQCPACNKLKAAFA